MLLHDSAACSCIASVWDWRHCKGAGLHSSEEASYKERWVGQMALAVVRSFGEIRVQMVLAAVDYSEEIRVQMVLAAVNNSEEIRAQKTLAPVDNSGGSQVRKALAAFRSLEQHKGHNSPVTGRLTHHMTAHHLDYSQVEVDNSPAAAHLGSKVWGRCACYVRTDHYWRKTVCCCILVLR